MALLSTKKTSWSSVRIQSSVTKKTMMATKLAVLAVLVSCAYAVGIYQQCAGDGYGKFPCDAGLTCFRRNKWYSSCQYSCPRSLGWECEVGLPPLVTPNVALAWAQCGGEGWVGPKACPANYTCYSRARYYAQVSSILLMTSSHTSCLVPSAERLSKR